MKKVIVASQNPVKVEAARIAFERMFPGESFEMVGVSAASGVSDQPMTDHETYLGAMNRIAATRLSNPDASYWMSFEGGVEDKNGHMEVFAWVFVKNSDGLVGKGRTATFFLPDAVAALVREGIELGTADDMIFKRENSKQQSGSVGILTNDVITRTSYYVEAAVLALIPYRNPELY